MKRLYTFILIPMLLMSLAACGGGSDSSTNDTDTGGIVGFWQVYHTATGGTEEGGDYLQIDSNTSGLWCDGSNVTISLSGSDITLSWTESNTMTISGTVSGNSMTGTYVDTNGSGTWRAVKSSIAECPNTGFSSFSVTSATNSSYEIWVGNQSYMSEPSYWNYYYSVDDYNFFKKGEAVDGGTTNITGQFKYYVVAVPEEGNFDSIKLGVNYLSVNNDGNLDWGNLTENEGNLYGSPDGAYATVGIPAGSGTSGGSYNGYLIFENVDYQVPTLSGSYQVWGGDTNIFTNGTEGYSPGDYGYTLLGESSTTNTFTGTYNYYVITVLEDDMAIVDTVEGSTGSYYGTGITGNTQRHERVGGAPDSKGVLIGLHNEGGLYGGYIVVSPNDSPSSITVYIGN